MEGGREGGKGREGREGGKGRREKEVGEYKGLISCEGSSQS
jgi:hypothetical protein